MKLFFIGSILIMCSLTVSCALPKAEIKKTLIDTNTLVSSDSLIVVSNLVKNRGKGFEAAFESKFIGLSNGKKISFIQYIDFIRSPYNKPDNDSYPHQLFIFITDYGIFTTKDFNILLELKYLNQEPFLIQKIKFNDGHPLNPNYSKLGGEELARAIVEEFKIRKIL
jgi:hypothetical protein